MNQELPSEPQKLNIPLFNQPSFSTFEDTVLTNEKIPRENTLCPNSIQDIIKYDLNQRFLINKQNLNNFIIQANHIKDMPINMKIFKSYFKVPFELFPESKEIMDIFSKIIQRILLTKTQTRNWYYEDIILLVWIVMRYCFMKLVDFKKLAERDWAIISSMIPSKTADLCKYKWLSITKINLQETPWTEEEDDTLKELLREKVEIKWSDIAKQVYKRNKEIIFRSGKLCRERWNNYLDPNLKKGTWSLEEDLNLLKLVRETGKKWSDISKKLTGRTENAVKNRFNSLVKKEKKKLRKRNNENINDVSFTSNTSLPSEEFEKEIVKNLILIKEQKSSQKPEERMEIETNQGEDESVMSDNSRLKKDKRNLMKERNIIHLSDLEIEKKSNILFELLKFDFVEVEAPINYAGNQQYQGYTQKPFISLNPVLNSSQSLNINPSLMDIARNASNTNIITSNVNFNQNIINNNQQMMYNNQMINNNPMMNMNTPFMNTSSNQMNNPMNNSMNNQMNNMMMNEQFTHNMMLNNTMMNNSTGMINNPNNTENQRNQLNHYYMQKNMELFEKFLLTNNSNINNYHNFQNLQKMQKTLNSPQSVSQSHFGVSNTQFPNSSALFNNTANGMNLPMNSQGLLNFQNDINQVKNPYDSMPSLNNYQTPKSSNMNNMKFEENLKNIKENLKNQVQQQNNQTEEEKNNQNFKFPSFIMPTPPVLINPLLQKIKMEDNNNNNSSSNTSSLDSFKSLVSSFNTLGSLSSLSNISEPSPNYTALSYFLNNTQNLQNPQNTSNIQNSQTTNLQIPFTQLNAAQLSNYNVKNITEFNMIEQNQNQLQFAIINPNKQEIYICGNLNNIGGKIDDSATKNKTSPRNRAKKTKNLTVRSPHSPKSKFHELSPKGGGRFRDESFDQYSKRESKDF